MMARINRRIKEVKKRGAQMSPATVSTHGVMEGGGSYNLQA